MFSHVCVFFKWLEFLALCDQYDFPIVLLLDRVARQTITVLKPITDVLLLLIFFIFFFTLFGELRLCIQNAD